jgi:chemotaxis protein methyltransferase WspC
VLSFPCATGEEAWSIAIALVAGGLAPDAFRIDALDLSERSLGVARAGVYRPRSLRGKQVDPGWAALLVSRPDGCIEVAPELRSSVAFARGNLREARALLAGRRYDCILSRNLLMYCDRETRSDSLATFVELLRPGGLLFLGHAEGLPAGTRGLVREGSPAAFAWRRADAAKSDERTDRPRRLVAEEEGLVARSPTRVRRADPAIAAREPSTSYETACTVADPLASARSLADRGELAEAAALVSARLAEAPTDASACVLLGIVLAAQGRDEEAVEQLRRSLYLEPENEDAMLHLALILDRTGQAKAAARLRGRMRRREAER